MRRLVGLVILLAAAGAQTQGPGAVFLMIFPDARTTALGGCGTASQAVGPSSYYNPAALATGPRLGATWTSANWLPGLYPGMAYEYAAACYRASPDLNLGASWTYLSTGVAEVVNERGEYLGRYRTWDMAVGASGGWLVRPGLAAGASIKYIQSFLVPEWVWIYQPELGIDPGGTGRSFGVDIGAQYRPWRWCGFGLAISNLGPPTCYRTGGSDPLPTIARFGWELQPDLGVPIGIRLVGDVWRELVTAVNLSPTQRVLSFVEELQVGVGLELTLFEVTSVRLGYFEDIQGQRGGIVAEPEPSIGLTRRISLLRLLLDRNRTWRAQSWGLCWGVGVQYREFRADVGVDAAIYDFPTRNVRFQLSWSR